MRKSKTKTCVIIVVCSASALFVSVIACCVVPAHRNREIVDNEISPVIDEHFAAIDNGTLAESYATHTCSGFRQTVSLEEYEELALDSRNVLGSLKSKSLTRYVI